MAKVGVSFVRADKLGPYVRALHDAGLETVPISPAEPRGLDGLDGLMLTGGGDVDPACYGAAPDPRTRYVIGERDRLEMALLAEAESKDLPVLAICRGLQLLNVARGGTLCQHVDGHRDVDHAVKVEPGSRVSAIFGGGEYTVNSRHHQAVDRLGAGLSTSARASDGTIEAVEDPARRFLVAVQWHPEDRPGTGDARLFQAFSEAVRGSAQQQADFGVKGKLAVVTGGANGIGFAAARLLAAQGARVWIFDLERERPEEAARRIGAGARAADVTDRASIDAALAATGAPDILVANAGTASEAAFCEHTPDEWNRILALNLSGAFHTVQAAARLMQPRRSGSIVLTASTNSYDGEAKLAAYNASKAGLLGLVHTAANELGPYGIRVNAVCPGLIRTRLTQAHFANPEILRDYFRHIPLGRGGEPEEVAQAIAFLASGRASYVTGATLLVDGGQMASKFGTWSEDTADFRDGRWQLR